MGVLAGLLGLLAFLGGTPGGSTALRLDSTSCHLARSLPGSPLESLSFLGKDAQGLALFHASWDAHRLLQVCSRHDAPELTAAFRVLCAHEAARGAFIHSPGPELQRALATLQSQWDACQGIQESPARAREKRAAGQSGPPGREHLRTKRGWTVPGTLWCGVGNSAGNSSELGIFQGPDLCCREHDRCPQNISPLQYNYGIRNFRFHTISHCDCDTRFKQCLRSQQDSVSDVVGVAFFNVLEIPCFLLEEKEACVAWYWWGGCRKYGSVPIAHIQPRTYYNASWNSPATTPLPSSPSSAPTKLQRKQRPWKRRPQQKESRHPRPATTMASQAPAAPSRPEAGSTAQKGSPQDPRGARRACRSLRQLEQCEHRIGPQETKFQLLNSAPRPLFHCNCTRRLARFLRLHGPPAGAGRLPELLGTTCFKLVPPLDCAEDGGCSRDPRAIKVSARHLLRLQKKHLQLQDRGLNEEQAWPSGPPGTPVSFYSQCLQLARAARGLRGLQDFSS